MRNEEAYIVRCLQSVIDQDYPEELVEVIVVDGGSIDNSVKIVKEMVEKHSNIKLLGGPGVNCPTAMNIGINNARGELISKIDGHGYVAPDFLRMGAKHLLKEEEIKCVGGFVKPVSQSYVSKANALARSSVLGVGKGIYSMREEPKYVDTVQCGVYKKDVFGEVGLFDESLQFGEDEEVNWRIRKKGYKILVTPEMRFFYFVRDSFGKLFKQYLNYGVARVRVIHKHLDFFNIKHIIPATFVLALFATGVLGVFVDLFAKVFFGVALLYLAASLGSSAVISRKEGFKYLGLLPISFAALHFGYGIGFMQEIVRLCFLSRVLK
jgi:glycosyltransferase involved in cell wall biosynthesis